MSPIKRIWVILWKSAAFIVLWALLYAPFVTVLAPGLKGLFQANPQLQRLFYDATGALSILAAAWLMVHFVDRRGFVTLGFSSEGLVRDMLLGSTIGLAWLALSLAVLWLFGWVIPRSFGVVAVATLAVPALAMLLNTVIQEVLARTYVFQVMQSQAGPGWAIFISSIIFMLYHAGGLRGAWLPAINVFLAGVLFAVAYYRTGNLWLPIAIHFAWNFLLGPVLGLAVSGQDLGAAWSLITLQGPALFTGGEFGVEGSLIVTLSTLVCLAGLWLWVPSRGRQVKSQEHASTQQGGEIMTEWNREAHP